MAQPSWAACPLNQFRNNPQLNQEIQNICANIANPKANDITANQIVMNGPFRPSSLTLVQMQGLFTAVVGDTYYCSNCTTDTLCTSTATAKVGSFSRISARNIVCQ